MALLGVLESICCPVGRPRVSVGVPVTKAWDKVQNSRPEGLFGKQTLLKLRELVGKSLGTWVLPPRELPHGIELGFCAETEVPTPTGAILHTFSLWPCDKGRSLCLLGTLGLRATEGPQIELT